MLHLSSLLRPLRALLPLLALAVPAAAQAQRPATFAAATTPSTGSGSNPDGIAVADVNGDGKPDLLTANFNSNTAGVLLGTGTGSFGAVTTYSTGSIQVTGTRSFSTDALYTYQGSAAQATGTGLPATVRTLTLTNSAGLTLTSGVTASSAATLTTGVLTTGPNALTLGSAATLSETTTGYATGTVQTTRPLATAGSTESFGGLGLSLTPSGSTLPGSTLVVRTTGTARTGAGTSQSVKRVFDIRPATTSGLNVALTLTSRDDERNGIAPANLRLFKSDDAGSTWQLQKAATVAATTTGGVPTYTASLGGISNFSLWTLGDTTNPLPVRAVTLKVAGGLALFPNPTTTGATLTGAVPGAAITVFDAVGRAVLTATADATGAARLVLPAGLPVGVYVVRTDTKALRLTVE